MTTSPSSPAILCTCSLLLTPHHPLPSDASTHRNQTHLDRLQTLAESELSNTEERVRLETLLITEAAESRIEKLKGLLDECTRLKENAERLRRELEENEVRYQGAVRELMVEREVIVKAREDDEGEKARLKGILEGARKNLEVKRGAARKLREEAGGGEDMGRVVVKMEVEERNEVVQLGNEDAQTESDAGFIHDESSRQNDDTISGVEDPPPPPVPASNDQTPASDRAIRLYALLYPNSNLNSKRTIDVLLPDQRTSSEGTQPTPQPNSGPPEKRSKVQAYTPRRQRVCSACNQSGHNVRTCIEQYFQQ